MNSGTKSKLLIWLVIVLLVANAATLAMVWLDKKGKHQAPQKGTPKEFLIRELKFDAKQQEQFAVLVEEHRKAADNFREKIKASKESLFELIKSSNTPDSIKQSAARSVSLNTEALDLLTLDHFQKVRALCTPDQQKHFDELIGEVIRMMGQQRPPGGPNNGHPGPPPGGGPGDEHQPPPPER